MSCRVLRRTVEDAILAFLLTRTRERGASEVEGWSRPTRKNEQASGFYRERAFEPIEPDGGTGRFIRPMGAPIESPAWIAVMRHIAAETA